MNFRNPYDEDVEELEELVNKVNNYFCRGREKRIVLKDNTNGTYDLMIAEGRALGCTIIERKGPVRMMQEINIMYNNGKLKNIIEEEG